MTSEFLAFIFYFLLMLGIGFYFFLRDRSKSDADYFLGGRQMGPFVTAMSAQASDMSGWLLMGFPGSILAFGMGKVWIGIGLALGTIANWLLVAKRLRNFSQAANDSITLPQYLTNRFATANPVLKVTCAVIFLISFTVYVASAFNAGTKVFVAVLPDLFAGRELLAMAVFAAIVLCYTFLGGFKAVCWTDFFQGLLMLGALLLVPIAMAMGEGDTAFYGAFAEGVDLPGSRLIGAIVFGVGLPGLSDERNMIRDYVDPDGTSGYDYAYTYPGMNRVLQAAGRVIRRDDDRGVVILADDRYADPKYRNLFPEHWKSIQYAGNSKSLAEIVRRFWNKSDFCE